MIVASILNALTSRSEIQSIIRYEARDLEAFFFHSKTTPDKLRIQLSEVVGRMPRSRDPQQSSARDPIADLERLSQLHAQGILSDEELSVLKAKFIEQITE
jgi:hypothetical protein